MKLIGKCPRQVVTFRPSGRKINDSLRINFYSQTDLESSTADKPRLGNLDYLRGLAAASIMIYHYATWSLGELSAKGFGGRIGIYGVAIFYVLSGLTLTYAYRNTLEPTAKSLGRFLRKRAFRIFPLLWLATLLSIAISKKIPSVIDILLNLSGLFGFVKWNTYFATGAWSIGNELVFYSVFPLLLISSKKSVRIFCLFLLFSFCCHFYFAFKLINPHETLSSQWRIYTNPINQVFFFVGGVALELIFRNIFIKHRNNTLLGLIGLGLLVFYPSSASNVDIVTEFNRVLFTCSCFLICLYFYKLNFILPGMLDTSLAFLGKVSYSIYLLHPIVYSVAKACFMLAARHSFIFPVYLIMFFSIITTLFISKFSYDYFEVYFIRLGNRL